jgi:hypothetical protein
MIDPPLQLLHVATSRMDIPPYLMETYKAVMRKGTTEELYREIENLNLDPNPIARSQLIPAVEEIIRERAAAIDSRRSDTIGFGFMTPEQKVAYRAKIAAQRLDRAVADAKKREQK